MSRTEITTFITFEADGKQHEARVEDPVSAADVGEHAMTREVDGKRYQIFISFGTGGFIAREIV